MVNVLAVGMDPALIDFSESSSVVGGVRDAQQIRDAIDDTAERLRARGHQHTSVVVDRGASAGAVLRQALREQVFDCVMVGAGLRLVAAHTALFETLMNIIRVEAPSAVLCFNTNPSDSVDAVGRWFPPVTPVVGNASRSDTKH